MESLGCFAPHNFIELLSEAKSIVSGYLVIIEEDNMPPAKWSLTRSIRTHPGKDGIVRL